MSPAVEQLVRETMELTGADGPAVMDDDAPVLANEALSAEDGTFYLVGLIGGKDVGKSMLVNALAGDKITTSTSYGPGTDSVIAYAHISQESALRELLDREVPGQYRIVTHDQSTLKRQVLLDLPDIDSHFADHLAVTRKMLRHMLFPIWLVSVEKYADEKPREMLKKVSAGNAPDNFIFCLNKIDQLVGPRTTAGNGNGSNPWGAAAASIAELREDYANRLQRTLSLQRPPRIYMISAMHPDAYEFPVLREVLVKEKTTQVVRESRQLAAQRQDQTLLSWLDGQQLSVRAQRLARLTDDARDLIEQRVATPILDEVVPRLLDDPATRGAMIEEIMSERVQHWPVLRLVHTLLSPVFVIIRGAVSKNAAPLQSPMGMVETVLQETGYSPADLVQTTFAQLRQAQPTMAELYGDNKLWEQMAADAAANDLVRTLGATVQRQREAARKLLSRGTTRGAALRWLLTVGAILWFPFVQPILHAVLDTNDKVHWAALIVGVLGVNYLWSSAGFLAIYFVILWLALRWNTVQQVHRLLGRWQSATLSDPSLNLVEQTQNWLITLITPLEHACKKTDELVKRADAVRKSLGKAA